MRHISLPLLHQLFIILKWGKMGNDQISILIIESDKNEQQQILKILEANVIESLLEIAEDTDDALMKIIDENPDVVFLEYPLKGKTGTGIIKFIQSKLPRTTIAFISSTKDYAAEAIHYEIYDYFLRPLKKAEVGKLIEKVQLRKSTNSLTRIEEIIEKKHQDNRLRFNTIKGYIIVNPDELLFCKSDGAFSELHFTNKSMELIFLYLSEIEEILNPYNFMRVSRSTLINKNYIRKVNLKTNTLILNFNGEVSEIIGSRSSLRELSK